MRAPDFARLTRQTRRQFERETGLELRKICRRCGAPTVQASPSGRHLAWQFVRRARGPMRRRALVCLFLKHVWRRV